MVKLLSVVLGYTPIGDRLPTSLYALYTVF